MKIFWTQVWLIIRNDLRLQRRSSRAGAMMTWSVLGCLSVLFHFVIIAVDASLGSPPSLQLEGLIWWFFAFVMLGTAMNAAIGTLYERADFDLLLASPVSVRAVLFARLGSMAAAALLSVAIFVPALLDPALFFFSPRYVAGFAVWVLLAAAAASLGTAFTLGLTRLLGARRARTVGQVIAALLGTSVYLAGQLPNLLLNSAGGAVFSRFYGKIAHWPAFLLPAEAGRGQARGLLLLALFAAIALGLTIRLLSRTFVSGLQEIAAISAKPKPKGTRRWTEGLAAATFWKDVRLITRDPLLLSQILPQTFYMLPLGFSLFRWIGFGAIAPAIFILALTLSATLTTVAVAGEECWDLVRMSPSPELSLRHAKMAAGLAVPLLVVTAVSVGLAATGRPGLGVLTFFISFACSAAMSRLAVSSVSVTPRRDVIRPGRFRSGGLGGNGGGQLFPSFFFMLTGGGGLGCAASGRVPVATAILLLLALLGAGAAFVFIKFERIIWRDDPVTS